MLVFVIGLTELHALILKHSDNLLPSSNVRIEFKLESECTLHSLNVTKLSKFILTKNAKDKMVCHLAQLSKRFNLQIFIGFTPTQAQAANLGTKYYEGLVSNINSSLWRHGSADKFIPLLDDKTTFLFTNHGNVTWAGIKPSCTVTSCQSENCKHISQTSIYDTDFCKCHLCGIDFWRPYKSLFSSEGHDPVDIDTDANVNCLQKMPLSTSQKSNLVLTKWRSVTPIILPPTLVIQVNLSTKTFQVPPWQQDWLGSLMFLLTEYSRLLNNLTDSKSPPNRGP